MMNGLGAPKRLPQMKTLRLCTVWSCVTGGETARYSQRSGHKFWGSSVNPNRHLRNVQGLG